MSKVSRKSTSVVDLVDMARDAERYRWLREHSALLDLWGSNNPEQFDEDVDAMAGAKHLPELYMKEQE